MTRIHELRTPAALIDTQRMAANIARLQSRADALGITVSTLKEAGLPCAVVSVGSTNQALMVDGLVETWPRCYGW